jgi:hypothetical protein
MARMMAAILAFFLLAAAPVWALTVKLAWDPYPNTRQIKGFELFYRPSGVANYDFDKPILKDIPATAAECTVEVPEDGFFVLRAITPSGKKTGITNEIPSREGLQSAKSKTEKPKIAPKRHVDSNAEGKIPPSRKLKIKPQGPEAQTQEAEHGN